MNKVLKLLKRCANYWLEYFQTTYNVLCFLVPIKEDRFILQVMFSGTFFIFSLFYAMFGEDLYFLYGFLTASGFLVLTWCTKLPEYIPIWKGRQK